MSLTITIPGKDDAWDSEKEEFITIEPMTLTLEHSLISISKWEETHHKTFLNNKKMNDAEIYDYIRCMVISPRKYISDEELRAIPFSEIERIKKYIEDPASATIIPENIRKAMRRGSGNKDPMTSERIYCSMAQLRLPAEYQKWRLPRLLTLIELCNIEEWKKDPKNKKRLNRYDPNLAKHYHDLNQKQRAMLGTKG